LPLIFGLEKMDYDMFGLEKNGGSIYCSVPAVSLRIFEHLLLCPTVLAESPFLIILIDF
jgi:hypothetical protein